MKTTAIALVCALGLTSSLAFGMENDSSASSTMNANNKMMHGKMMHKKKMHTMSKSSMMKKDGMSDGMMKKDGMEKKM